MIEIAPKMRTRMHAATHECWGCKEHHMVARSWKALLEAMADHNDYHAWQDKQYAAS